MKDWKKHISLTTLMGNLAACNNVPYDHKLTTNLTLYDDLRHRTAAK